MYMVALIGGLHYIMLIQLSRVSTGHSAFQNVDSSNKRQLVFKNKFLLDEKTIGEGRDLEHVEKGCLGHTHLVSSFDQRHILRKQNSKERETKNISEVYIYLMFLQFRKIFKKILFKNEFKIF